LAAILRKPIVVGAKAGFLIGDIIEGEETKALAGIEHGGLDSIGIHVLEPRERVPTTRARRFEPFLEELLIVLRSLTHGDVDVNRLRELPIDEKQETSLGFVAGIARRPISKGLIDARLPQIRRLGHMGVRGDQFRACWIHNRRPLAVMTPATHRLPEYRSALAVCALTASLDHTSMANALIPDPIHV